MSIESEKPETASGNGNTPESVKQRILSLFIERAKLQGARAVSTDDIARELSISKKTLYKHYSSKELLIKAVLDLWAVEVQQPIVIKAGENPKQVILEGTEVWHDNDARFCPQFWEDVGEDYPALRKQYFDTMFERMRPVARQIRCFRKPHLGESLVRELYFVLALASAENTFCRKADVSSKDALMQLVSVWVTGCFDLPDSYPGDQEPGDQEPGDRKPGNAPAEPKNF